MLKSAQWNQSIQKSLRLSSKISEMFKAQDDRIAKSFSGISMVNEIAKNLQQHFIKFHNPALSTIEAVLKSINLQTKTIIPQTTIDAIASINQQHEHLFSGLIAMTESLKIQSEALAQINNLNFALSAISRQVASIAAQQRDWTIIDDFEEINEQAIEFSESLTEVVTEEQENQFQILIALVSTYVKTHGNQGLRIIHIIFSIFFRFADTHQYYDFLKEKSELATKQSVNHIAVKQDSVMHFMKIVDEKLKQKKEYRVTNRVCEVRLKPKSKTTVLSKLPKDFEVIVLQVHHKWVYVSYFDSKDSLPQTGWIMKKYLNRPD